MNHLPTTEITLAHEMEYFTWAERAENARGKRFGLTAETQIKPVVELNQTVGVGFKPAPKVENRHQGFPTNPEARASRR